CGRMPTCGARSRGPGGMAIPEVQLTGVLLEQQVSVLVPGDGADSAGGELGGQVGRVQDERRARRCEVVRRRKIVMQAKARDAPQMGEDEAVVVEEHDVDAGPDVT